MKLLIKYIVFIIAFSISPELHAGLLKGMFNVRQIGHTEGLSSQRVFSIVEDKHSVIWIATKNGIDRYNGQSVKNYTLVEYFSSDSQMNWSFTCFQYHTKVGKT